MNWKPPDKSQHRMNPEITYQTMYTVPKPMVYWEYCTGGEVIFYSQHEHAMSQMQQRITYLENVCDEHMRMLTGD